MKKDSFLKLTGVFIFSLIISFLINYYSNAFSPHQCLYGCIDPAYFYMIGKAWAHGMLPYAEVVDVKGPLVFLIFRLGYLFTPDDTIGTFAIYVAVGAMTLTTAYRAARFMGAGTWAALVAAVAVMGMAYWTRLTYGTAQLEILALPLLLWLIGDFCLLLNTRDEESAGFNRIAWSLGIGFACMMMYKFNMALPFVTAGGICLYLMWRRRVFRQTIGGWLWRAAAGAAVVILPFFVYMVSQGICDKFVSIYFLSNFNSYFGSHTESFYSKMSPIRHILHYNLIECCCIPTVTSLVYLLATAWRKRKTDLQTPILLFVLCLSVYGTCIMTEHIYYFVFCAPVTLFPIVAVCRSSSLLRGGLSALMITAVTIFSVVELSSQENVTSRKTVLRMKEKLSAVSQPKIIYWKMMEMGIGYESGVLPACPVWTIFNGMPDSFYDGTRRCIREGGADFIFTHANLSQEDSDFLRANSYEKTEDSEISIAGKNKSLYQVFIWQKKK